MLTCAASGEQPFTYQAQQVLRPRPATKEDDRPVVSAVAIHPLGKMLITAGDDHRIHVWRLHSGKSVIALPAHTDWIRDLCFSEDGRQLASVGSDGRVLLWDATSLAKPPRQIAKQDRGLWSVEFDAKNERLVVGGFGSKINIYDIATGKIDREITCQCVDMRASTLSPNGKQIAAGGRSGKIRIWDTNDGTTLRDLNAHQNRLRAVLFSNDGRSLVSAGEDRAIRVWDVATGSKKLEIVDTPGKVIAMTWHRDKTLVTAGSDNMIRLWSLETGKEIARLKGHEGSVAAVECIADTLVSGSFDTTARIWTIDEHPTEPSKTISTLRQLELKSTTR